MAKKKHQEEHENLERWLVSYADFMTLLFATFVVLYGLAMSNAQDYTNLQDSLERAFSASSLFDGSPSIMGEGGNDESVFDNTSGDSVVPPLLELLSPKYEQESFEKIKEAIEKDKDLKNDIDVSIDERGLVINILDSDLLFESSSTKLTLKSTKILDKVGGLIKSKFNLHNIRVEGHTDSVPMASAVYPSNWELSAARAGSVARYLITNFSFKPNLFSIVGYADTRPIADNQKPENRKKNRRVEIIVLKNKVAMNDPESSVHQSLNIYNNNPNAPVSDNKDNLKNLGNPQTSQASPNIPVSDKTAPEHKNSAAVNAILEEGDSKDAIIIQDTYKKESDDIENQIFRYEQSIKGQAQENNNRTQPITQYSADEKVLNESESESFFTQLYNSLFKPKDSSGTKE